MTTTITVFLLISMTAAVVVGYPDGPPAGHENLCATMVPGHGASEAVGDAPFTLTATKKNNTTYTVLLNGTSSDQSVYGFFIEARPWDTSSSSESTPADSVGTFASSASGTQLLDCFRKSNNAWGHSNADPKDNVTATWTAPSGSGYVRFRASVVLADFKQYWVGLYSDVADYNAADHADGLRFSVMALLVSLLLSFLATTRM